MDKHVVVSDPEILGGIPVLAGTAVSVRVLFGNLAEGATLDDILQMYPELKREQVVEVLREAEAAIEAPIIGSGMGEAQDKLFQKLLAEVQEGLDEANRGELIGEANVWRHFRHRSEQLKREWESKE